MENAFVTGLRIYNEAKARTGTGVAEVGKKPQENPKRRWSIMTKDTALRRVIMSHLDAARERGYGPTTHWFGKSTHGMIDVPYSVVVEVSKSDHESFVVFFRDGTTPWSLSETYTRANLSDYFGSQFKETYQRKRDKM